MMKILREYSYLFCLTSSLFIFGLLYLTGWLPKEMLQELGGKGRLAEHMTFVESSNDFEIIGEKIIQLEEKQKSFISLEPDINNNRYENTEESETAEAIETTEVSEKENIMEIQGQLHSEKIKEIKERKQEGAEKKEWIFQKRDVSYFDDALFIGDSRTEGLKEYGDLGNAVIISDSGMSIYRVWKESFSVKGNKQSLEELLLNQHFGKIYLMLGVNELGYDFNQTKIKYEESLAKIKEAQPDAIIYLQANLHVTDEKSKNSDIYNNENINRINLMMKDLAEKNQCIYLDVNPLFDDENGNLSKEYTVDQAHILGIYYSDWTNWILENCAVVKEEAKE